MKHLFYILSFVLLSYTSYSQSVCCPKFSITADFQPCDQSCRPDPTPGGIPSFIACKNIAHTYTVIPNLPGFTYTWTVLGGTPASFTGNPIVITWGSSTQGFIKVVITNADGSCQDSVVRKVCLVDGPKAGFTFAPIPVCLNSLIQFTNASVGGGNYYWDFGDGNTSTLQNPAHVYTSAGTYTVTLSVSSAGGGNGSAGGDCKCRDVVTAVIVVGNLPGVDIHTDDCRKMLCKGDTVKYCTSTSCTGYVWSVNGGSIISGQGTTCIMVVWNLPSVYPTTVSLNANCTGTCGNTATLNVPVLYPNLPIQGPITVCPNSTTNYSLPILPGTFYKWTLSGGGVIIGADSNINNINVNWGALSGSFVINCVYQNPYSGCSGNSSITVNVRQPFTLLGLSPVCVGTTTTYTANGGVASWTTSPATGFIVVGTTGNSRTIKWTAIGNYTLTAFPNNPLNFCSTPGTINIVVVDTPKLGTLTGPAIVCPNQLYSYAISSNLNGPFTWTVTGGGTVVQTMGANSDSVLVKWTAGGSISVTQTANGCTSSPKFINVTLVPVPNILPGPLTACEDGTAIYTATGAPPPGNYTWSLSNALGTITGGQGTNIITVQWHGTSLPGTSTCNISVTTCGGSKTITITVTTPGPVTITKTGTLCSVAGMTLTSSVTGALYQWFLNGVLIVPNTQSINVTTPGTYSVIVTPASGCPRKGIIIVPAEPLPVASISANGPLSFCPGQPISTQLQALSNPGYCFQWYLNGNPISGATTAVYNATVPGTYTCLVSFCSTQCKKFSNPLTVAIGGCCNGGCGTGYVITTTHTGCNPITFTATISPNPGNPLVWDFGDGTSATGSTVSHQYLQAGNFTVCVSTTGPGGCCISHCETIQIPLAAAFGYTVNCSTVSFANLSQNLPSYAGYSINWSFTGGSPATSNLPNPVVTFASPGSHPVTLTLSITVNGNPCVVTLTQSVVTSAPLAAFTVPTPVCALTQAPFTTASVASSYHWDFGDTYASNLQNTTHAYAAAGTYTVTLTVSDVNGCTNSLSQLVNVLPPLSVSIQNDVFVCPGSSTTLSTTPGTFTTYQWYKDGVPTVTTPTYTTNVLGEYWVVVSNGSGCSATSNHAHLWNYPLPIAHILGQSVFCSASGSISLQNSVMAATYSYNWTATGPGTVTFNPNNTSPAVTATVSALGTYQFKLIVTDNVTGCAATDSFCVFVFQSPSLTVNGPTGSLCEGTPYTFTAVATPPNPNYIYHWSNGATGPVMTTAQAGLYFVTVTDPVSGCSAQAFAGIISKRPDVDLFPIGCDTLCDTVKLIPPLPLITGQTYPGVYTIQWFVDGNPFFSGSPLLLSSLTLGAHTVYIVVTDLGTGCSNTSGTFNIFIIHCDKCNCKKSFWEEAPYVINQSTGNKLKISCNNPKPYLITDGDCRSIFTVSGLFICADTTCKGNVIYQLFDSSNTLITSNPGSLTINASTLENGTYYVNIYAYCGTKLCDSCKFKIVKNCPCCIYSIKVSPGVVTYTQSPNGNATIGSEAFTISGLSGVNLTQVRAEVLSYSLSSNFNNECLGCKTIPFTWASIASASNIGTVSPAITIYGGTTTVFAPTGPPQIYQNPREVTWYNGGSVFMPGTAPVGINFIFPPIPVIDCCVLNATVCVKFTFRDDKCSECEVIVCFDVKVNKNTNVATTGK